MQQVVSDLNKIMRILLNLVLVLILLFSISNIYLNVFQYKKADSIYEDIRQIRESTEDIEDNQETERITEVSKSTEDDTYCELLSISDDDKRSFLSIKTDLFPLV